MLRKIELTLQIYNILYICWCWKWHMRWKVSLIKACWKWHIYLIGCLFIMLFYIEFDKANKLRMIKEMKNSSFFLHSTVKVALINILEKNIYVRYQCHPPKRKKFLLIDKISKIVLHRNELDITRPGLPWNYDVGFYQYAMLDINLSPKVGRRWDVFVRGWSWWWIVVFHGKRF